jgi:hypothetical protein
MTITTTIPTRSYEFEPEETLAWSRSMSPLSKLSGHRISVTYDQEGNFARVDIDDAEPETWVDILDIASLVTDLCPPAKHPSLDIVT